MKLSMICLAGLALAKMKISILALASVQALEMPTKDGSFVKVNVIDKDTKASLKGQRIYKELEDLAVKMFNDDVIIKSYKGENYFTKESWTQEFMNYACYCNTRVTGGGAVPGTEDPNDELCNDLFKCYKCINIDYDHEGTDTAEVIVYTANYEPATKTIQCLDQAHLSQEECPHNICQCDRQFIIRLLHNYKQCILGNDSKCYKDSWRYSEGFDRKTCFTEKHSVINDKCCGVYPNRVAYNGTRLECCSDDRLRQPGTC